MGWEEGVGYPGHWMGDVVGYPVHHPRPPPPQDMGLGYPNLPPQTRPGYVTPSLCLWTWDLDTLPPPHPTTYIWWSSLGTYSLEDLPLSPPLPTSGGSKGGTRDSPLPGGPNSFNFMQFLGKFGKILCWCPPRELANPSRGNPGSATANSTNTNAS